MIIIIISFYKKENFTLSSEVYNNINSLCNNEDISYLNGLKLSDSSKIRGKKIKEYMLDTIYPIGTFYVQYPSENTNIASNAFPLDESPAKLFGGTWTDKWTLWGGGIYFRTEGSLSNEQRFTNGIQEYAMKHLVGHMSWMQSDENAIGSGNTGVFGVETGIINKDDGGADDPVFQNYFDSSIQVLPSDNEIRVKNRLIKVWKRTA